MFLEPETTTIITFDSYREIKIVIRVDARAQMGCF